MCSDPMSKCMIKYMEILNIMIIFYIADGHYEFDDNKRVFVESVYGYRYWKKYLYVFKKLYVIGRGRSCNDETHDDKLEASGKGVDFRLIEDFVGVKGYIKNYLTIRKKIAHLIRQCDGAIVRLPSPISPLAVHYLIKYKKPFVCEMVSDPGDMHTNSISAWCIRNYFVIHCKISCKRAEGVSFVTKTYFQKKYWKKRKNTFTTNYVDVLLPDDLLKYDKSPSMYKIEDRSQLVFLHVSNAINDKEKGHYECVDILSRIVNEGINAKFVFIGDGIEIPNIEEYAEKKGVEDRAVFRGKIGDYKQLIKEYYECDFFIFPSHREGVPRVVIEAMACGRVCLASKIGGIPDILPNEVLFKVGDIDGYVNAILTLVGNRKMYEKLSVKNLNEAKKYSDVNIQKKRNWFYSKLRDRIEYDLVNRHIH